MDLNGDQPPFWSQPTTSMPRRRSSAPLVTLPILIVVVPIIALLLLFFIVPPFLSLTSQIFRPYNIVKKGWDSLNILLVLFAILCGIFPRRNGAGWTPVDSANNLNNVSDISDGMDTTNLSNPQKWFDDDQYPNAKVCDRPISTPVTGRSRLRRSSSSYPDMRQDSLWETGEDRFRFFDDLRIRQSHRSPDNNVHQLRRTRSDFEEYSDVKVIAVDSFLLRSSHAPPPKSPNPPPPPPPPPPPVVRQRPRQAYQKVGRKDMSVESDVDMKKAESPPVPPAPLPPPQRAPPPPPLPEQMGYRSEQKCVKIEHRKSNATKEIKMVLASLYNQRKRIKRKHKTNFIEEYSKSVHSPPQYSNIPPPSPPPPPLPLPPHPSSVFQNIFKKSSKTKKVHSVPPPAPPPPPPPRSSNRKSQAWPPMPPPPPPVPPTPPLQPYRRRNAATSGKPPLPAGANNSYDENLNSSNQSPQIPVPPPFKTSEFRFVVRGDFVNIHSGSARNSRCSYPDPKEVDNDILSTKESTAEKVNAMDGGDEIGSVFCPSPDVNVKADTFIARLRDGWRLEKMNSLREKQSMGPGPR